MQGAGARCCSSGDVAPIPADFCNHKDLPVNPPLCTDKNRGSEGSENLLGRLYVLVPCQVRLVPKSTAPPTPYCLPGPAALAASRPVNTLQPSGHLFSYLSCGWVPPHPPPECQVLLGAGLCLVTPGRILHKTSVRDVLKWGGRVPVSFHLPWGLILPLTVSLGGPCQKTWFPQGPISSALSVSEDVFSGCAILSLVIISKCFRCNKCLCTRSRE